MAELGVTSRASGRPPAAPAAKSRQFVAVAEMLYELGEHFELGVLELARRTGVSVGTAQRITAALVETGLLAWNPATHKYSLGNGVLRLHSAFTQNTVQPLQRSIAELERLSKASGETAAIHRIVGKFRVILAQVVGPRDLTWRADVSRLYPLHAGAASKALLAWMPSNELAALLDGYDFARFGRETPGDLAELQAGLKDVRRCGYAMSYSEREPGAGGIAVPLFNAAGAVEYSVSVYGPEQRVRPAVEQLVALLRESVARMSAIEPPARSHDP